MESRYERIYADYEFLEPYTSKKSDTQKTNSTSITMTRPRTPETVDKTKKFEVPNYLEPISDEENSEPFEKITQDFEDPEKIIDLTLENELDHCFSFPWIKRVKSQSQRQQEIELQKKLDAANDIKTTVGASGSKIDTDFKRKKKENLNNQLTMDSAVNFVTNLLGDQSESRFYADLIYEELISLESEEVQREAFALIMEICIEYEKTTPSDL